MWYWWDAYIPPVINQIKTVIWHNSTGDVATADYEYHDKVSEFKFISGDKVYLSRLTYRMYLRITSQSSSQSRTICSMQHII